MLSINGFSQKQETGEIYRYLNKDAIIFDYSTEKSSLLINKYFGISDLNEDLVAAVYKTTNFDLLSPNNIIGEFIINDTISVNQKLNFEDINFAIKNLIGNNGIYGIKENKYGYYLINLILRFSNYSDEIIRVSIKIRKNSIIISSKNYLYINVYNQVIPRKIAYNDKAFGYDIRENADGRSSLVFVPEIALKQLYYYASILETKKRFIELINKNLDDVLKIK